MIFACIALGLAFGAIVLIIRQQHTAYLKASQSWTEERRELLNRIQAPDRIPFRAEEQPVEVPLREPDDWNKVGSIHIDPEYLTMDED